MARVRRTTPDARSETVARSGAAREHAAQTMNDPPARDSALYHCIDDQVGDPWAPGGDDGPRTPGGEDVPRPTTPGGGEPWWRILTSQVDVAWPQTGRLPVEMGPEEGLDSGPRPGSGR